MKTDLAVKLSHKGAASDGHHTAEQCKPELYEQNKPFFP